MTVAITVGINQDGCKAGGLNVIWMWYTNSLENMLYVSWQCGLKVWQLVCFSVFTLDLKGITPSIKFNIVWEYDTIIMQIWELSTSGLR